VPPIVLKSFAGGWDRFRLQAAFSLTNYKRLREKDPAHFLAKRSRCRDHESFSGLFKINQIIDGANICKSVSLHRWNKKSSRVGGFIFLES